MPRPKSESTERLMLGDCLGLHSSLTLNLGVRLFIEKDRGGRWESLVMA